MNYEKPKQKRIDYKSIGSENEHTTDYYDRRALRSDAQAHLTELGFGRKFACSPNPVSVKPLLSAEELERQEKLHNSKVRAEIKDRIFSQFLPVGDMFFTSEYERLDILRSAYRILNYIRKTGNRTAEIFWQGGIDNANMPR